jgi:CII-binding regulator of phage lambda lysogenization HflD
MGILTDIAGLPLTGPLSGLAWLARRIAEAAEQEQNDPSRIETALLALERQLEAGEIDDDTHAAREAELLEELAAMQVDDDSAPAPAP